MTKDEARDRAWIAYNEKCGHFSDRLMQQANHDGFDAGFDAGYAAAEGRWVAINSVEDLPKEFVPQGYLVRYGDTVEIWYRKPDVTSNTESWLGADAWMPIPAYKEEG